MVHDPAAGTGGSERDAANGVAAKLFQEHAGRVFVFCLRKLGSREEAEDATQETFFNASRSMHRGFEPDVPLAWLLKIAENVCHGRHRARLRKGPVESLDANQVEVVAAERPTDDLVGLPGVLQELPDDQRRAFLLREWRGLAYHEIASELDTSHSAVAALIFRARRTVAKGLGRSVNNGRKTRNHGLELGPFLAAIKALFAGTAAIKTATAVVAVTTVANIGPALDLRPARFLPGPTGEPDRVAVEATTVDQARPDHLDAAAYAADRRKSDTTPLTAPVASPGRVTRNQTEASRPGSQSRPLTHEPRPGAANQDHQPRPSEDAVHIPEPEQAPTGPTVSEAEVKPDASGSSGGSAEIATATAADNLEGVEPVSTSPATEYNPGTRTEHDKKTIRESMVASRAVTASGKPENPGKTAAAPGQTKSQAGPPPVVEEAHAEAPASGLGGKAKAQASSAGDEPAPNPSEHSDANSQKDLEIGPPNDRGKSESAPV